MKMSNLVPLINRPSSALLGRQGENQFTSLQNEINNLFDNFFRGYEVASLLSERNAFAIPVDVIESEDSYKIEAELPGMEAGDVDVSISENYCTIKCQKQEYEQDKGKNYLRQERSFGVYQRTIQLPEYVNADKAEASFKRGVLWVEIPKKAGAESKRKKLKIKEAA